MLKVSTGHTSCCFNQQPENHKIESISEFFHQEDHKPSPECGMKRTNEQRASEPKLERRGRSERGERRRKGLDGAATRQESGQPQSVVDLLR